MKHPLWYDDGWNHIWLPYAQMKTTPLPLPVSHTEGCRIILEDGRELVDGVASWWSACHGYNHPHIIAEMEKQLRNMPHVMFAGLAHEPAYRLAQRLAAIAPPGLSRVFFSDSGSTAVEVALKMALQYWRNQDKRKKQKFICIRNGYHGDTLGTMSVSDPENSLHKAYAGITHMQYVVDIPHDEYALAELDTLLESISGSVAAMIMEPLVQGAGGMKFHSADILAEIYRICRNNNILFIADEVMTGFGRTGNMFACDEAGITPDIMCVGKALTGGVMTLAATMATDEIFAAFYDDDLYKALMHGPTFMANPLACAAANASLDLFEREPRLAQVEAIEQQLHAGLSPCKNYSRVKDVRVKGAIGVVQLHDVSFRLICELRRRFIEQGVWLRPIEDIIYIIPPFTISESELSQLTQVVCKVIK